MPDQLAADPTQALSLVSVNQNSSYCSKSRFFAFPSGSLYIAFSDKTSNNTTVYLNTNDFEKSIISRLQKGNFWFRHYVLLGVEQIIHDTQT